MKRNVTDVLRRGIDSTVANWPLIAMRIAATIVVMTVVILSVIAAVVPMLVSAGLSHFNPADAQSATEVIASLVTEHFMVLVYVFLLAFAVLFVVIVVQAFVDGGTTQILVDAERRALRVTGPDRGVLAAFSMDRWFAGAKHSCWTIFWIYNIVWSFGLLIVLVPLLLTLVGMLATDTVGTRVAAGCVGLAFAMLLFLPIAVVCTIWTEKSIAVCVSRNLGARAASGEAWRDLRADFGRHFGVGAIVMAVSFGMAMAVSMTSMGVNMTTHHAPGAGFAFLPLQILGSFAQSILSAATGIWFRSSFVSLTEEK